MKKNFDIRLAALREYLRSLSADETVFIVEGGGEFRTAEDAFTYLRKYGAVTPDGKRIVLYPHPVEGVDPLSLSLYQMIDEAIEQGKLELPELESDDLCKYSDKISAESLMMRRPTPGASIGGRSSVRIMISGTAPLRRSCASATKRRAARRLKRMNASGTAGTAIS